MKGWGVSLALSASALASLLAADPFENWTLLMGAELTETGTGADLHLVKTFPTALETAAPQFEIAGYLVPVLAEPFLDRFLLVPDPADCPYCGLGGYGPSLEVDMKRALPDLPEGAFLTLRGRLELNRDGDSFELYRLVDAVEIASDG
ncbi:MAG: hypothetical protein AAGF79_04215 [Pseudomonadota bacterium]